MFLKIAQFCSSRAQTVGNRGRCHFADDLHAPPQRGEWLHCTPCGNGWQNTCGIGVQKDSVRVRCVSQRGQWATGAVRRKAYQECLTFAGDDNDCADGRVGNAQCLLEFLCIDIGRVCMRNIDFARYTNKI